MALLDERTCKPGIRLNKMLTASEAFLIKRFLNNFQIRTSNITEPFVDRSSEYGDWTIWIPEGGGGGEVFAHGWKASVAYDTENEEEAATVTVKSGFRIAIGGNTTREPQDHTITVTSEELASGVWIIKQFSGTLNAWIEGIQKTTEQPEDEAFVNTIDVEIDCDTETAEVEHEVWPETFRRQRRVVCYLDSVGLKQCAVGAIYVVGNPDMEVPDEDVDEDDADEADDVEGDCNQNDHPGDDYDDDDSYRLFPIVPPPHPGDDEPIDEPIDEDDDDHPGSDDCYTTR